MYRVNTHQHSTITSELSNHQSLVNDTNPSHHYDGIPRL